MPAEIDARGFIGSSVYDLLTKFSICGNKRIKALKLLSEIDLEQKKMRSRCIRIRNTLMQLVEWFSAWTNNPHTMKVWVRIQHGAKEKKS